MKVEQSVGTASMAMRKSAPASKRGSLCREDSYPSSAALCCGEDKGKTGLERRKGNVRRISEIEVKGGKSGWRSSEETAGGCCIAEGEAGMSQGAGNHRVCNSRRRAGRDSYHCHNRIPAEAPRALGCNCRRDIQSVEDFRNEGYLEVSGFQVSPQYSAGNRPEYAVHTSRRRMYRIQELLSGCLDSLMSEKGQSTVEFAIVFAVLLCVVAGVGIFMDAVGSGMFVEHAVLAASHNAGVVPGGATDVFCY